MSVPFCFVNWEALLPHAIPTHWCWCILKAGGQGRTPLFYLRYFFCFLCACGRVSRWSPGIVHVCAFRCFVFVSSLSVLADLYIIVFKLGHGFRSCCYNWYSHSKLSGGRACKCEPSPCCFGAANRQKRCYDAFNPHVLAESNDANNLVELFTHDTFLYVWRNIWLCSVFFLNTFLFLSWHTPPFFASPFLFFFLIVVHRLFLCSCWLEGGRLWCC